MKIFSYKFFLAFFFFFYSIFAFSNVSFAFDVSSCTALNAGYQSISTDNKCIKKDSNNFWFSSYSGNIQIDRNSCKDSFGGPINSNFHVEGDYAGTASCVSNTQSCSPEHSSIAGKQTWNIDTSTWGQCEGFTCNSNFYPNNGQCVAPVDLLALSTTTTLSPTATNPITTGDPLDLNLKIGVNGCSGVAGKLGSTGIISYVGGTPTCPASNLSGKRIFFSVDWDSEKFSLNTKDANNYSNCRCDHVAQKHPINLNGAIV